MPNVAWLTVSLALALNILLVQVDRYRPESRLLISDIIHDGVALSFWALIISLVLGVLFLAFGDRKYPSRVKKIFPWVLSVLIFLQISLAALARPRLPDTGISKVNEQDSH